MKLLKSAILGATFALLGAGAALAEDCCKGGKPCCEKKDEKGAPMPCCEKHEHDGPKTEAPKSDAPQPAPDHEHKH
jgi:hypothetical protein